MKTKKYSTYILLIPVEKMSDGRKALEAVEDMKYKSIEAVQNAICFNENDPMAIEDLAIIPISDFMDMMNNQSYATPEDERIDFESHWLGYVQILE